jgi:predicted nucleic acid-binding protein
MTPRDCVVDASTVVKLFLAEAHSDRAIALFALLAADPGVVFHVPDLLYAECANIFWKQCQRGSCSPAKAQTDVAALRALRLTSTPTYELAEEALALAQAGGITAYDACYVALAVRQGVPLITADQKLVQKLASTAHAPVWLGAWVPPP